MIGAGSGGVAELPAVLFGFPDGQFDECLSGERALLAAPYGDLHGEVLGPGLGAGVDQAENQLEREIVLNVQRTAQVPTPRNMWRHLHRRGPDAPIQTSFSLRNHTGRVCCPEGSGDPSSAHDRRLPIRSISSRLLGAESQGSPMQSLPGWSLNRGMT